MFPGIEFRIIFTNEFKISDYFNFKDKIPDGIRSNICYLFTCPQCSLRYIGCSTSAFNVRIFEHLGKSIRTNSLLAKPPFSAIRDHCHNQDHPLNKNNLKMIANLRNQSDTFPAESILIISSNLSWKPHIQQIAKSASAKLGILFRCRPFFTCEQSLRIYKGLIRPCLDQC